MRSEDEVYKLVEKMLSPTLDEIWNELEPAERRMAGRLFSEIIESLW